MTDLPSTAELGRLLGTATESLGDRPIDSISTDSRTVQPGALFLALEGERFDGHAFVARALGDGALAAVVKRNWTAKDVPEQLLLRVDSPLHALHAIARWRRERFEHPVVAVTGSVGKTTTKQMIVAALEAQGPVLYTRANYNNQFGVPATLLELEPAHRFAVIEMGMRGVGEIHELGQIALPDVAVITNVGTAHIGRLGSREAIAKAKCELLQTLKPEGIAILNGDDSLLIETAASVWEGRTMTYGLAQAELRGELRAGDDLRVEGHTIRMPLPGAHQARNLLAALAVATHLGVPWSALTKLAVALPTGRARRLLLGEDIVLWDDTYNAGLESMIAALHLLKEQPATRRIAVLGTMKELGDYSVPLHEQVGRTVASTGMDALFILADPAEADAMAAGAKGVPIEQFASHDELLAHLRQTLAPGDCVLFKASRAVALDQVIDKLIHP